VCALRKRTEKGRAGSSYPSIEGKELIYGSENMLSVLVVCTCARDPAEQSIGAQYVS
jgi:hypothetical protein